MPIFSGLYKHKIVAKNGDQEIVDFLLALPVVFAWAEQHEQEYGALYVHPFMAAKLEALRAQKNRMEQENPDAVFDIANDEEARLLFLFARNLIRRTDNALRDDLHFLLEIPAVKALAHTEVTPQMPNELLRLAMSVNNEGAAALLLTIPAVHALALQNNYYHNESRGGLDLQTIAQDHESSMQALSTGEQHGYVNIGQLLETPARVATPGQNGIFAVSREQSPTQSFEENDRQPNMATLIC